MILKIFQIIGDILFYIKIHRRAFFASLSFFALGFVIFFSSISYNPIDLIQTGGKLNYFGTLGANIANFCLQYFGFATYFMVLVFFRFSFLMIANKGIEGYKTKFLSLVIATLSLCFILGSVKKYELAFFNPIGGYVGFLLSNLIVKTIFFIPLLILSFIILVGAVVIVFEMHKSQTWLNWFAGCHAPSFNVKNLFRRNTVKVMELLPPKEEAIAMPDSNEAIPLQEDEEEDTESIMERLKQNKAYSTHNIKQKVNASLKYLPPEISLLDLNTGENNKKNLKNISLTKEVEKNLYQALADFGIEAVVKGTKVGPVVTIYEIEPKAGIRAARVMGLAEDIARSLKAKSARISLIPSSSSLAVEIPNKEREIVFLRELIDGSEYRQAKCNIPITLGKSMRGDNIIVDLASMPHLLIAGTTGSGKSVGVNAMILSVLYKLSPSECQFIMIDPKMLELSVYNEIPHLLTPVITESEKAVMALKWLTLEMERRYRRMSALSVRNIFSYNTAVAKMQNSPSEEQNLSKMPFIVVVIDEMADLMITAGKVIEGYIQRLAQMARAAGIHVIMATQRPSVDVITGIIKANFPTRISYQVSSKIDSRTILGTGGAECLLGKGDMLYMQAGAKTYRIHAPFVSDNEVHNVVSYLKQSCGSRYNNIKIDIFEEVVEEEKPQVDANSHSDGNQDSLYSEALEIVISENKPSISYIQRRLRIGYNKAANLIEKMEQEGIVSKPDPVSGKRLLLQNNG